jgi:hypothetical protein
MNCKRFGRKRSRPSWDTILEFAWRERGNIWETSARTARVPVKIRTEHLPNRSPERYRYSNRLGDANTISRRETEVADKATWNVTRSNCDFSHGYYINLVFKRVPSSGSKLATKFKQIKISVCCQQINRRQEYISFIHSWFISDTFKWWDRIASNEMTKIWMESVVAYLGICLEGQKEPRNISVGKPGIRA